MNTIDYLQDALSGEMALQSMYNQLAMDISKPDIRQLFIQLRDTKMQHITQIQHQIEQLMRQGLKD